ncbi:unnamed protein product [Rhizoctonia solani]|uniref:FAD-binding FR-type domain-containing protein n=1 Tax=Rhizoctonia solani TaxID=456999 RepID=A0A8H3BTX4_9AGAM|nr:unnamed protein product [Rhizoctonia solani]
MGGSNNLTYLLPAVSDGPPSMAQPPFPPDYLFALGYEIFIISTIVILMLFSLPRTVRFLRSERKFEGWWLYQSKRPISPISPVVHITRSKAELVDREKGTVIMSPQSHRVVLPGLHRTESDHGSSSLSKKDEGMRKASAKESTEGAMAQPILHQGQGAVGACLGWTGAKMTKFIGGPVSMHLGPWLVVFLINIVANVLISLAPPFFIAPDRPAHIAIAQIPILFVLGTKNNILSYMLGKSYEKLNFVHRSVGRLLFICATMHAVGQFVKYSTRGVLGQVIRVPWVQAGLAAWIGLILVTFASIGVVRIKFYDFFLNSHTIGIFVFVVALHFRDRSWESHPFTIANAPASHALNTGNAQGLASRGILLYARAAGNFTRALNADAHKSSGIQTRVIVDGPYGGLAAGMVDPAGDKNVILVAGGGGASFTISVLEDLVSRALEKKACTETIDFIWVVKEYGHLDWYMPTIKQLTLAAESSTVSLRVHLYVTKLETAPNGKFDRPLPPLPSQAALGTESSSSSTDVIFKRPDITAIIGEAVNYAALTGQSSSGGGGVMICACGPVPMIRDVQLATRRISIKDRRLAGGVSLHTEAFGL